MTALCASLLLPHAAWAQGPGTDIHLVSIHLSGDQVTFDRALNITNRDGYDNQPSFLPDGNSLLYSSNRGSQTDIYRYFIATQITERVTNTAPESEYSPAIMPGTNMFSVVRVEADSTQRLWQFDLNGANPRVVLTGIKPVGYHAWGDANTVALFILGDSATPATLQLADVRSGRAQIVAYNIGRSLHRVPGRAAISFTHRVPEYLVKQLDLVSGAVSPLMQLLSGNEYYAWLPDGSALMGLDSKLFRRVPTSDSGWQQVADLSDVGISGITRLAVSPAGDRLAIVAARPARQGR
ncbi:MAG: hypothetical protein AMS18_02035 [Gemmatimonas sp. SG8_17]|nr:MAG: hypothetical protein AMS18_02035 [Gemmatimonas sp. SG8_17]